MIHIPKHQSHSSIGPHTCLAVPLHVKSVWKREPQACFHSRVQIISWSERPGGSEKPQPVPAQSHANQQRENQTNPLSGLRLVSQFTFEWFIFLITYCYIYCQSIHCSLIFIWKLYSDIFLSPSTIVLCKSLLVRASAKLPTCRRQQTGNQERRMLCVEHSKGKSQHTDSEFPVLSYDSYVVPHNIYFSVSPRWTHNQRPEPWITAWTSRQRIRPVKSCMPPLWPHCS